MIHSLHIGVIGDINFVGREGKDQSFGGREEAINFSAILALDDLDDLGGRSRRLKLWTISTDNLSTLSLSLCVSSEMI